RPDDHEALPPSYQDRGCRPRPASPRRTANDARGSTGDGRSTRNRRYPSGRRSARRRVILADTSAWVEYDRATGSAVHHRMTQLIHGNSPLVVTEPVIMEVLSGARNDAQEDAL